MNLSIAHSRRFNTILLCEFWINVTRKLSISPECQWANCKLIEWVDCRCVLATLLPLGSSWQQTERFICRQLRIKQRRFSTRKTQYNVTKAFKSFSLKSKVTWFPRWIAIFQRIHVLQTLQGITTNNGEFDVTMRKNRLPSASDEWKKNKKKIGRNETCELLSSSFVRWANMCLQWAHTLIRTDG